MSLYYKYEYVDVDQSDTLENLVESRLASVEKRVLSRGDKETVVSVKFVVDARSPQGTVRDAHVVMNVKLAGVPKLIVAKKSDADLKKAVTAAADALLKEIRRYTEKQEHLRQHDPATEIDFESSTESA
jgi:ribosome-associated translation inhibitor RaiA